MGRKKKVYQPHSNNTHQLYNSGYSPVEKIGRGEKWTLLCSEGKNECWYQFMSPLLSFVVSTQTLIFSIINKQRSPTVNTTILKRNKVFTVVKCSLFIITGNITGDQIAKLFLLSVIWVDACVISGFRRHVNAIYPLLGRYAKLLLVKVI